MLKEFAFNDVGKDFILDPIFFWLYINYPIDIACNTASDADYTTFYSSMSGILIEGNSLNWLLNWNLSMNALWIWEGSNLPVLIVGKPNQFNLIVQLILVLLT